MTPIEDLARQAGMIGAGSSNYIADRRDLERFAALVRAEAREAALEEAAQKCLSWGEARKPDRGGDALRNCAAAIRALKAKG